MDEYTRFEGDARGQIRTRKQRVHRFIALDIQIRPTDRGSICVFSLIRPVVLEIRLAVLVIPAT